MSTILATQLPFSQACENNKRPILAVLKSAFAGCKQVLEIGSGTGQHAVYFAQNLPHLQWHPSDKDVESSGIRLRVKHVANVELPKEFDVSESPWPHPEIDAVFSANTCHIMPWHITLLMLNRVADTLPVDGVFALYGPFNYNGSYSSPSNAEFDEWLVSRDPQQGIRDIESVSGALESKGMLLVTDHAMPANNRLLVWKKISTNAR